MAADALNRGDLAIRLYNRAILEGKNVRRSAAANGPFLMINAADIVIGDRFTFHLLQFDLICSDLSQLEVARAVAASSAVPGAFSPISLRSWTGQCGYEPFEAPHRGDARYQRWRTPAAAHRGTSTTSTADAITSIWSTTGLPTISACGGRSKPWHSPAVRTRFRQLGVDRPKHIAVIVVDAEVHPDPLYSLTATGLGLAAMITAVSGVQIYSHNFETLELLHESMKRWQDHAAADPAAVPMQTYISEIEFETVADPKERDYLNDLPTSFSLTDAQVDRLIADGRWELRRSPDFQRLFRD